MTSFHLNSVCSKVTQFAVAATNQNRLWCFHTSHMLLNKFSNKLLKLLLNLYSPCCSTEPFTLATSSATCCWTCVLCLRMCPCFSTGPFTLDTSSATSSATCCRTCSATCGQCESTIRCLVSVQMKWGQIRSDEWYECCKHLPTKSFVEIPEMMWVSGREKRRRLSYAFKTARDETAKFGRLNRLIGSATGFSRWCRGHWCIWWWISHQQVTVECTSQVVSHQLSRRKHTVHTYTDPFYGPLDFVWDYPGEPIPEPI